MKAWFSNIAVRTPKPSIVKIEILEFQLSKVGFPIRKSVDQSFFAAPHGLSQRSTSFIASQRQGIHRTPLRHLIALIINVHTLGRMHAARTEPKSRKRCDRTLRRKTSLLRKIEPIARRSSFAKRIIYNLDFRLTTRAKRRNDPEIMKGRAIACTIQLGSISSLRCQKTRNTLSIERCDAEVFFADEISWIEAPA